MTGETPEGHAADDRAMLRINKILTPTDFSDCADRAFEHALVLGRRYGAEVHLAHVMGPIEGDAFSPLRYSPEAAARGDSPDKLIYEYLQGVIVRHETDGVFVEPVKLRGRSVPPALVQYAAQEGIDLIVMGAHEHHGMQRLFMGHAAERTVLEAPCSVLSIPECDEGPHREGDASGGVGFQRMLVPVDFSPYTEPSVRAAVELAAGYGARLDLLHVVEPVPFLGSLTGMITLNDMLPDFLDRTDRALRSLWDHVQAYDLQADVHVKEGHAASTIVDFAKHTGADLIVMGAHGQSGLGRFLMGSVVERVVRHAECPVLTFRAGIDEVDQEDHDEDQATVNQSQY